MSWTDEQLREFNALSDRLVAERRAGDGNAAQDNGRPAPPSNIRPLRLAAPDGWLVGPADGLPLLPTAR